MTTATKKISQSTIALMLLITGLSLFPKTTLAQSTIGVSAIPPRLEINIKPDETITKIIKVRNESNSERVINTKASDFIVTDNKGTPIQVETNEENNRWAASSWIQVSPSSLKLKPGETKSLTVVVMAPKDALPGGHYAMILSNPENVGSLSSTGASVQSNVGTLIYVTVAGDVKQDAQIQNFTAPNFSEFGPIDFKSTIKNLSDIHIKPVGAITIKNFLGGQTAKLSITDTNIFPYTSRDFTNTLNRKWLFGRYKAEINAAYGTAGGVATAVIFFWVIPWRLIALLIAAAAIVTAIILINKNKPKDDTSDGKVEELEKELNDLKKKYKD